jgi:hypothetical protein
MRNARVILIAFLAATSVFAALHGAEEFQMAFSYLHPRPAIWTLLNDFFLRETARALPFALAAAFLLSLAVFPSALALRKANRRISISVLSVGGGILGAVLSVIVYAFVGGWGPPYFFQSVACGATLGALSA